MNRSGKTDYIEIPTIDLAATKAFFAAVFDWNYIDYGDSYTAIENAGIDGGFFTAEKSALTLNGSVLVVLYNDALESTLEKVKEHGGNIVQAIFSFPGGRRFHLKDPSGNEYAVWSE